MTNICKAIFLIISSNDNDIYIEFKKLHRIYLKNYRPFIKYYFIEYRDNQESIVMEEDDHIYIKGEESINPGMILKTCVAINYLNQTKDYEYIVRTNLSTLFHMPNLLDFLYRIPNNNSCAGFSFRGFITGTGIILSKDVSNLIVNNFLSFDLEQHNEDVLISGILNNLKIPYFNCNQFYKWGLLINEKPEDKDEYFYMNSGSEFKEIEFPDNILHFRIKSSINRLNDILYFKFLLNKIYNIVA